MARTRGANALQQFAFEDPYATPPAAGSWFRAPFVSHGLGEEQNLIESPDLGYGREMLDPSQDVANDEGDLVVGVDERAFGYWLTHTFGEPTTTGAVAATGDITFSAQPAAGSTVTINSVAWTFRASGASGNEVNIGVNLAATMTALAAALNGSSDPLVSAATYTAHATSISIAHDTAGVGGNAFTLAKSGTSNATVSGATLTGGANKHAFTSGLLELPSMAIEYWHPEIETGFLHTGVVSGGMKIALARSGMLNATLNLVAQGEAKVLSQTDDDPEVIEFSRFAQFIGAVSREGSTLGHLVSAEWGYSNDLDKIEVIRSDGRIEGADPGFSKASGSIVTRFADTDLYDAATDNTPCELTFGWQKSISRKLLITQPRVWLPKTKRPITGPAGIQATAAWQASNSVGDGYSTKVELTNDVASYALA